MKASVPRLKRAKLMRPMSAPPCGPLPRPVLSCVLNTPPSSSSPGSLSTRSRSISSRLMSSSAAGRSALLALPRGLLQWGESARSGEWPASGLRLGSSTLLPDPAPAAAAAAVLP
jgi:hypothetical protein